MPNFHPLLPLSSCFCLLVAIMTSGCAGNPSIETLDAGADVSLLNDAGDTMTSSDLTAELAEEVGFDTADETMDAMDETGGDGIEADVELLDGMDDGTEADIEQLDGAAVETITPCLGNGDGVIDQDEFAVTLGVPVSYTVNKPDTVVPVPDLEGTYVDGIAHWDFSQVSAATDEVVVETVEPLDGYWFAGSFPSDAVVMPMESQSEYLGVYTLEGGTFSLLGMAQETAGGDLLVFEEPLSVLELPLALYDSHDTGEIEATGTYDGETYPADYGALGTVHIYYRFQVAVDAAGEVATPLATFPVLRIHLQTEVVARNDLLWEPVNILRYKSFLFLAECYGIVARVKSTDDEPVKYFGVAAEYRRIGGMAQ